MQYFRIDAKEFITPLLSSEQKGSLIYILSYASMVERIPSDLELEKLISKKKLKNLRENLEKFTENTLDSLLNDVMQDVESLKKKKELTRKRVAKLRDSKKCNALQESNSNVTCNADVTSPRPDQTRPDHINNKKLKRESDPLDFYKRFEIDRGELESAANEVFDGFVMETKRNEVRATHLKKIECKIEKIIATPEYKCEDYASAVGLCIEVAKAASWKNQQNNGYEIALYRIYGKHSEKFDELFAILKDNKFEKPKGDENGGYKQREDAYSTMRRNIHALEQKHAENG